MSFIMYRVRNVEPFKDGNIMEGRFLKPGEVLVVTETEKNQIIQSGGILEVLETLVPNPKKAVEEEKPVEEAPKASGKNVRKTKN